MNLKTEDNKASTKLRNGIYPFFKWTFSFMVLFLGSKSFQVNAQEFTIKRVEMAGDKLNVYYDLKDTIAGNLYTVNIYSSLDNFVNPLGQTTGDLGQQVKPGLNKKISWNAQQELGVDYDGKVGLEIRGRIFIPFITLKNFKEYKSFKRTQTYPITWSGGTTRNVLTFSLMREKELVTTFTNVGNLGSYDLVFPKTVKPGNDYYFKISDAKNKDESIQTEKFSIKRKVPLALKAAPLALIGVLAYVLFWPDPEIPNPAIPRK